MRFSAKRLFLFLIFLLLVFLIYRTTIKTGYSQAVIIEDTLWGIEREIIPPESYRILLRKLIPGRIELHPVFLESRIHEFPYVFPLPSKEILGLDDSFSIRIHLVYIYDLDVNKLSELFFKLEKKRWDHLDGYIAIKMHDVWYRILKDELQVEKNLEQGESQIKTYIEKDLLRYLNQNFRDDGIFFKNVYIRDIYIPDPEQYRYIITRSNQYLERKLQRSAFLDEAKIKRETERITFEFEKERLEELAKLMKKYPEIREYLRWEKIASQTQFIFLPAEGFLKEERLMKFDGVLSEKNNKDNENTKTAKEKIEQKQFIDRTPP